MPVRKYRTHEEAQRDLWLPPGDPRILKALAFVLGLNALAPTKPFPRGVHRYRSIEEANAAREAWTNENIRRIQAEGEIQPTQVRDAAVPVEPEEFSDGA